MLKQFYNKYKGKIKERKEKSIKEYKKYMINELKKELSKSKNQNQYLKNFL